MPRAEEMGNKLHRLLIFRENDMVASTLIALDSVLRVLEKQKKSRVVELLCSVMTARQAREPSRRILASSARWFPPLDATLLSPALKGTLGRWRACGTYSPFGRTNSLVRANIRIYLILLRLFWRKSCRRNNG